MSKTTSNKKQKRESSNVQDIEDSRFQEIKNDPRFLEMAKQKRKIQIDKERFGAMFDDSKNNNKKKNKDFNVIGKYDKTGKIIKEKDRLVMEKYYSVPDDKEKEKSDEESSEEKEKVQKKTKFYDEEGNFEWNPSQKNSSESSGDSESSSGEDDESEQDEMEEGEGEIWDIDIPQGEIVGEEGVGNRIALNQMDWDLISAVDILALFSSLCQPSQIITKVEIYPSLFGIEQMKKDSLLGPPKEIFENEDEYQKKLKYKKHMKKKNAKQGSDSDSEIENNELLGIEGNEEDINAYNQNKLRKYELQKMKYFYAIVHCDSSKTALHLYDEFNGYEFENSNIQLQMSLVPNDIIFEQQVKESAESIPSGYEFNFDQQKKVNRALGHTSVKLTWDQTDVKRQQKLKNGFKLQEESDSEKEKNYYKDLIASGSDEEDKEVNKKEDIEQYRRKLLDELKGDKSLLFKKNGVQDDFENINWDAIDDLNSDQLDSDDIDQLEKTGKLKAKKEDKSSNLDIKFSKGFSKNIGKQLLDQKQEKKNKSKMTEFEKYQEKKRERKLVKKQQQKENKEKLKKMSKMSEKEIQKMEKKEQNKREALQMLVGDQEEDSDEEDTKFQGETADPRFVQVLNGKNKDFALDPTHKDFRKIKDGAFVKKQRQKI